MYVKRRIHYTAGSWKNFPLQRQGDQANCKMNPTVQIVVTDGLSSSAITANVEDVLPAIEQGLKSYGIDYGCTFFVKYGRVGVMDDISEVTG